MILRVNGKHLTMPNQITAFDLIGHFGYQNQRIALEVNGVIVPKSQHTTLNLCEHDIIEIIKAVGGG